MAWKSFFIIMLHHNFFPIVFLFHVFTYLKLLNFMDPVSNAIKHYWFHVVEFLAWYQFQYAEAIFVFSSLSFDLHFNNCLDWVSIVQSFIYIHIYKRYLAFQYLSLFYTYTFISEFCLWNQTHFSYKCGSNLPLVYHQCIETDIDDIHERDEPRCSPKVLLYS